MSLRIRWTLLSTAGLALGIIAALVLGAPVEAVVGMILVTPVLTGIVGAALGTSQWLLLRRRLANARWWIPASTAGLGIGLAAGVVLVEQVGRALKGSPVNVAMLSDAARAGSLTVVGLVSGLALGIAQWLVLRSRPGGARTWLWVSTFGMGLALLAGSLVADLIFGGLRAPVGFVAFVLVAGLIAGAVTSAPLDRLSSRLPLPT
jgi:hypothetical protein